MADAIRFGYGLAMRQRDLEAFDAVMRAGGAGRAAELLGTSQPAVSRALAALERVCGFALFDRIRGRLVPTREGRLFHAEVGRAFRGLDHLRQSAVRIREVGEGVVRVAALSALGNTIAVRATARFLQRRPDVRVSLQIRTSAAVRDLVANGQVDLGVAADEVETGGIEHSVFATPRAVCVVPAGHPLAARRRILAGDLAEQRLLALAPQDTARLAIERIFEAAGVRPRIVVETPFSATIVALASEGVGIGFANPLSLTTPLPEDVVALPFDPPVYFRTLLLRPAGAPRSRLIEAYAAALLAARTEGAALSRPRRRTGQRQEIAP
jgi:DNA-binding transcriptional LysR family regulator